MRNRGASQATPILTTPRTSRDSAIQHEWLRFKFHEQSGSVVTDSGGAYNNGASRSSPFFTNGQITLAGTAPAWTVNRSVGLVQPATDTRYQNITSQALLDFVSFRLASQSQAQILVMFWCYIGTSSALSLGPVIFDTGWQDTTFGGWALRSDTSRNVSLAHKPSGNGTIEYFVLGQLNTALGHMAVLTDFRNLSGGAAVRTKWLNGAVVASDVMDSTAYGIGRLASGFGVSLFQENSGLQRLGNAGAAIGISDFIIIRATSDISGLAPTIVEEAYRHPGDSLRSLVP